MPAARRKGAGPGAIHRPVAHARAEAYTALSLALHPPALCWCRSLRRVMTALGRVMLWHPQPQLEEQVGALRRRLHAPSNGAGEEHRRLFEQPGSAALVADLSRMAVLCVQEARAWATHEGAVARTLLLQQRSLLRSLRLPLARLAEEAGEGAHGILIRIAWGYVVLDDQLVAAVLMAVDEDRVGWANPVRAR